MRKFFSLFFIFLLMLPAQIILASQHDMEITTDDANTGITYRAAANSAFQALASTNSGTTAPSTPYSNQLWADTTNGLLKIRNTANTAWITLGSFVGEEWGNPVQNIKISPSSNAINIYANSSGAAPGSTNTIRIKIPNGTGAVFRERSATYLSGASTVTMADGANYWSKGSANSQYRDAYLYAIWDGTGIVWALAGYTGFTMVPTTTTATDDDYFLLEDSSTYTRNNAHYCVCVARIRYKYYTSDTPDHTIQTAIEDAPTIMWNPRSDYGKTVTLATTVSSGSDITEASRVSAVVKQTGMYLITAHASSTSTSTIVELMVAIKTGSATYGSAGYVASVYQDGYHTSTTHSCAASITSIVYVGNGSTIHLGASVTGGGTRNLLGDSAAPGRTALTFKRID